MTTKTLDPTHPVLACLAHLAGELKAVREVSPVYMRREDKAEALRQLVTVESALASLKHRLITAADDVAADLDPALLAGAETRLVGFCAEFGPLELRRIGRRILEVIAPDSADEELAKKLEREEARARVRASVRQRRLGDGLTRTTIIPVPRQDLPRRGLSPSRPMVRGPPCQALVRRRRHRPRRRRPALPVPPPPRPRPPLHPHPPPQRRPPLPPQDVRSGVSPPRRPR